MSSKKQTQLIQNLHICLNNDTQKIYLAIILLAFKILKKVKKSNSLYFHRVQNSSYSSVTLNELQHETYQSKIDGPFKITNEFKEKP